MTSARFQETIATIRFRGLCNSQAMARSRAHPCIAHGNTMQSCHWVARIKGFQQRSSNSRDEMA